MPSFSLIDEKELMDYWGNEEDEEGYNDDDDHYVDVEDEGGSIVVDKLVILMCCVWMIYEFRQGICGCMLTCSIDNFYGFLETLPMGFVRFVDMFYEFLCLEVLFMCFY